jgi:hypothetical protein
MTNVSRFVLVCGLAGFAIRCSADNAGLGVKFDAAAGGARDSGADQATASGGKPGVGGTIGTGGSVATGGAIGTGGSVATGGIIGIGGVAASGGVPGAGGRGNMGGATGAGGSKGKDAGPGCGKPDAGAGCCYIDEQCPSGSVCVGGDCSTNGSPGVCKTTADLAAGQCWRDADCPSPPGKCLSPNICGCGLQCFAADTPGTCGK